MQAPREVLTASAVTRAFFDLLESSDIPAKEIARLSGVHVNTLYCWRTGKAAATILNMESASAVLGFELAFQRVKPNNRTSGGSQVSTSSQHPAHIVSTLSTADIGIAIRDHLEDRPVEALNWSNEDPTKGSGQNGYWIDFIDVSDPSNPIIRTSCGTFRATIVRID